MKYIFISSCMCFKTYTNSAVLFRYTGSVLYLYVGSVLQAGASYVYFRYTGSGVNKTSIITHTCMLPHLRDLPFATIVFSGLS
jgi:hypothetical protein